ncbi:beta-carotene 15,15'-dioxygenase [Halobacteriales archaeon SW_10_68_16]|jgi:Brp/Blh family beta-carotene 15,15'-monooxygenase|nr:MAG: beta-carotene 15,15'-dioxygenase [Halobacteriales archaeon SW_10_68_16]
MGLTGDATADAGRAKQSLGRVCLALGWVPVLLLVPLAIAGPEIPPTYRYVPLVASVALFGMPHGAVDYVAGPRASTGTVSLRGVGLVVLLYFLLGGAYLVLWFLAPVPAALFFVLLTWFHWGQGDLYAVRGLFGTVHVDDSLQAGLTVLVRGGLPMLVSLLGFPERYRAVVESFVGPFGANVQGLALFDAGPRVVLGVGFALVTLLMLARGYRRARRHDAAATDSTGAPGSDSPIRGWGTDAAETVLLWMYFLVVPPVLAVGVYFCLWHSLRHIARVVLLDPASVEALSRDRWARPTGKFALEAAVPTVLALGLVGLLWVAVPGSVDTLAGATGLYLVGIAVLTLPHTAVVLWLDREQRVWP